MQTSVSVTLQEKTHVVNYPNVGQKLKIENLKMLLTNSQYGDFVRSGHKTALALLDLVDAFSYFMVLIPDMKLTLDKFNNLDPFLEKEVRTQYITVFLPFCLAIERELNGEKEEVVEDKKQEENA